MSDLMEFGIEDHLELLVIIPKQLDGRPLPYALCFTQG